MNSDTRRYLLTNIVLENEYLLLIGLFIFIVLLVVLLGVLSIKRSSPVKRKLAELTDKKSPSVSKKSHIPDSLTSLAPLTLPKSEKERQTTREKLLHAGFDQPHALSMFYTFKSLTILFGSAIIVWLYWAMPEAQYLYTYMAGVGFLGLFLPNILLQKRVSQRQQRIRAGIPDMLDLLVVCTESGLGFNASLQRVANEISLSHLDLANEMDTVCQKIQAGKPMADSLKELVNRTGLNELMGLVSMLSHAAKVGGSLVNSLREYTEDYRDRRQQAAEELAAKIPVKMMFPMILFIWPCFFIVTIGPALISLADAFSN
ncbi:pilus assembly protein TadC [Vibrio azureus]|uniref:Type II secretion system protein GspF domain-containing protein n=1 Tax=Vibrio azureus NBRC 104587 TaxID=1219077 RepID=U3C7I7_9VIBR|nr:type II secretion system F family protein [Vibrio azureus]AUI86821.1 pilus assembly protein TadC [Vibrio azureus]GAD74403.1 hypothetical protein VAZ01S_010_00560 [Vibrio azureus NBRC 104587]